MHEHNVKIDPEIIVNEDQTGKFVRLAIATYRHYYPKSFNMCCQCFVLAILGINSKFRGCKIFVFKVASYNL